jgi:putative restriction endonuclease
VDSGIALLPAWHRSALAWFADNAGRTFAKRPFDVGLPVKLTSLQKGIWKPAATPYALSVVQTHKGVYPDQPPEFATDGTWTYLYHQEGATREDLADPTRRFANVALFQCMADGIPVGVITPSPGGGYQVLGLAFVEDWASGFFVLSGPAPLAVAAGAPGTPMLLPTSVALIDFGPFDPSAKDDGRQRVIAQVVRRRGQPRFRKLLLHAYEGRCAMSDYDAEPALEAAHIISYRGSQTDHPANGLLLRADLHDLFDLGLVAVDTGTMKLALAKDLVGTTYEPLAGHRLRLPSDRELRPSVEALDKHRERSLVA